MNLKKIMLAALLTGTASCMMAQSQNAGTWKEPKLTPIYLDSVRAENLTDEAYLERLTALQNIAKQNDAELKACITEVKDRQKSIDGAIKVNKSEQGYLSKDEGLLNDKIKTNEKSTKNLQSTQKAINKNKEYSPADKESRLADLKRQMDQNNKDTEAAKKRLEEIKNKDTDLQKKASELSVTATDADKRLTELTNMQNSLKIESDRINNELKLVKIKVKDNKKNAK